MYFQSNGPNISNPMLTVGRGLEDVDAHAGVRHARAHLAVEVRGVAPRAVGVGREREHVPHRAVVDRAVVLAARGVVPLDAPPDRRGVFFRRADLRARSRRLDRARSAANGWGVRMARATNLICILVIAGTAVGVRAVVCRVGRPFSGGRLGRVARGAHASRFWRARFRRVFGAHVSGAGDAVNDKYEKKTVPVMYICRRARISSIAYYAYVRFVYYYLLGHVARY